MNASAADAHRGSAVEKAVDCCDETHIQVSCSMASAWACVSVEGDKEGSDVVDGTHP